MLSAVRRVVASNTSLSRVVLALLIDDKSNDSLARVHCATRQREVGCQSPEAEAEARDAQRSTSFELLVYVNSIYTARLPTKSL